MAEKSTHLFSYKFTGSKPRCQQGCVPSRGSRGEQFLCHLQLPELHPSTVVPSFIFKAHHSNLFYQSCHHIIIFSPQISLCLPLIRTSEITFTVHHNNPRESPHLNHLHMIKSTKSLLPFKVTFTHSRDLSMSISGAIIQPTISCKKEFQRRKQLDTPYSTLQLNIRLS